MTKLAEFPFDEYKLYGPTFHKKQNWQKIILQ
jgi:hypothetical protein